jgi:hypothetical protein
VPLDEVGRQWNFPGEGMFCHGGFLNSADVIVKVHIHHVYIYIHQPLIAHISIIGNPFP